MLTITALYAGLAGLIFTVLSLQVSLVRKAEKQSLGDGGHSGLGLAIRRQANFAEYAPISLILIGLIEMQGAPGWAVHAGGLTLIASRLGHSFGMNAKRATRLRFGSMVACYALLAALSLANLGYALL